MNGNYETEESSIFGMGDIEYCKITSDTADVKAGLGIDFETITILNKDDIVKVLSQVGDRYVVQLDNNQIGSVDAIDAQPIVREDAGQQSQQPPQPTEEDRQEPGGQWLEDELQTGETTPTPQPPEGEEAPSPQPQPRPVADSTIEGLTSQENEMLGLVNNERERNNLPALVIDLELTRVARIKSQDMEDNNYFSHYSPTYGSPFDMMDSFGIKYLHAGENLAGNPSVEDAHVALMNSSGHRKNILSPDFTHIGIGVKPSNRYGLLFTQMFISKPQ